jgi:hypothetical protein
MGILAESGHSNTRIEADWMPPRIASRLAEVERIKAAIP